MKITHFGLHSPGNAGDTVLFEEVRHVFQLHQQDLTWQNRNVRSEVLESTLESINRERSPMIVGGGGLLLSDTAPNDNSGWQWNCPLRILEKMSPPLAVFAIGYNRFPGQSDFGDTFRTHISKTVEKAAFFGLRNHGSIAQLKRYLPPRLADKLAYQPCPTAILSVTHPHLAGRREIQRRVTLNAAFDREQNRYGDHKERIFTGVARAMSQLSRAGWTVDVVLHLPNDDKVVDYLVRQDVSFNVYDLHRKSSAVVLDYYTDAHIVVGMRGHSQMIPFGLGKSIVSLISHPKLGYFLDDIGHPEWGIDVFSESMPDELVSKVERLGRTEWRDVNDQIDEAMRKLSAVTDRNVRYILGEFNTYRAETKWFWRRLRRRRVGRRA